MPGRSECVCREKDLGHLIQAFCVRQKTDLAAQVGSGKSVNFKELTSTIKLVAMLADDNPLVFRSGLEQRDIHLEECPCSPRYQSKLRAGQP